MLEWKQIKMEEQIMEKYIVRWAGSYVGESMFDTFEEAQKEFDELYSDYSFDWISLIGVVFEYDNEYDYHEVERYEIDSYVSGYDD